LEIKKTSIIRPIKRKIVLLILAIFTTLAFFVYLQCQLNKNENEDKQIMNIFEKQRMSTQLLSKDANHLYVLLHSLENVEEEQKRNQITNKIIETKEDMYQEKEAFSAILASMQEGYLYVEDHQINIEDSVKNASKYLEKIDKAWLGFLYPVDTLLHAEEMNSEVDYAISFINNHNEELAELCDKILSIILADSLAYTTKMKVTVYIWIGILTAAILFSLIQLMRYIILPFNQMYEGISELGLMSYQFLPKLPTKKKVTPVIQEINDIFVKFNDLKSLIENMNNNGSFMGTLNFINQTFSGLIPYNYIGIALFIEDKKLIRASYGVSDGKVVGLPENLVGKSWPIDETSLGRLLQSGKARIINDLERYTENRPLKPYNKIILEAGIRASITLPLNLAGEPIGVIFFSSTQKNVYKEEHLNILRTLANSIAISFHQNIFIDDVIYSSILALAKLAEARDEDTGEHLERMKMYSRAIAEFLYESHKHEDEITLEYIEQIERFSPLHDIGKVGIRDGILLKPGKLTAEEFEEMKKHTTFGAEVLKSAEQNIVKYRRSLFGMGIEIAQNHHEKWDGSGYPCGKKGEEIPLSARIVAVADVFDALMSKRPYKEAFSTEKSFSIIQEGRGGHFDPEIVDVFVEHRAEIEKMCRENQSTVA